MIKGKDKENERLNKTILDLQQRLNDSKLKIQNDSINTKQLLEKLKEDLENLLNDNQNKDNHIYKLNQAVIDLGNELETKINLLNEKNNIISSLSNDKEILQRQINNKQNDFIDFQNSSQQEIDILQKKLLMLDEEKNKLSKNKNSKENEIENLKDQLKQYELNNKSQIDENMKMDQKYNDLLKAFDMKEKEHQNEINKLSQLNTKCNNDLEILKAKYEKKVQLLKLSNNELNERVKNLINSLIALKDYAITLERNMNDANLNLNNSLYTAQGLSYLGINHCCNSNLQNDPNVNNNELVKGMKDIISKIDSKIFDNNQIEYINY